MNQNLSLVSNKIKIGVVRNPYERVITEYHNSLNYIGLDNWIHWYTMTSQKEMYKDSDILIRLEDWKHELQEHDLVVEDTSILDNLFVAPMWEQWYTLKSKSSVALMYREDITTFGYSI